MAKDPICGMSVDERSALRLTVESKDYFFCNKHCLEKFARKRGIPEEEIKTSLTKSKNSPYKNKTLIIFFMAGVVTDCTEIGFLWHNAGRRSRYV